MVLADCSKCQVYLPKEKKVIEGRVELFPNEVIRLYFSDYQLNDGRIKTAVRFFDGQRGLVDMDCELVFRRNDYTQRGEPWIADCSMLGQKREAQNKRGQVRVKASIEIWGKAEKHGDFPATIRDVSTGGVYISTIQPLSLHEMFAFRAKFDSTDRAYTVRVVRGKREPDSRYGYGCRFLKLSEQADAAVGAYVFKKMQEQRAQLL